VGLVLGAGGVMGGAWLTGALDALAGETGWDPGSADYLVGTSAGAMMGSLVAGGVPPWFMVAHSAGRSFPGLDGADGRPAAGASRGGGSEFRVERRLPRIGPGSWSLALATLRSPGAQTPSAMVAGWLPEGMISTEPLKDIVRRVVPSGWADHPHLWVVACNYATGRRVVFGREGAPDADLADAVAASCAIPAFYRPVEIAGVRYVDGGLHSVSNLDVLSGLGLDLVISLNPTTSLEAVLARTPAERVAGFLRRQNGRRLGSEARRLREEGVGVLLVQPTAEDLAAMGPNLMRTTGRNRVIQTARRTVAMRLAEPDVSELLRDLPPGQSYMVREPASPPSGWAELAAEARRRRFGRAAARA
jgi:NTE family protein